MAIQDDISNFFDSMLQSAQSSARRSANETRQATNVLAELDPMTRANLEMFYNPEQYSSLEEAIRFDPILADRVMRAYDQQTVASMTPEQYPPMVPSAMMPDTMPRPVVPASVPDTSRAVPRPRPPVPMENQPGLLLIDAGGADSQGQGMDDIRDTFMNKMGTDLNTLMTENPKLAQAAIREMEKQASQEGLYGTQAARLRAAAEEETGLSGRELGVRTGREGTLQDEINALQFGALASTGAGNLVKGGIKGAQAVQAAGGLRALLNRIGLGNLARARQATNQTQYPIGLATRFQKAPQGPAMNMTPAQIRTQQLLDAARRAPGGYADGGRLRDGVMDVYDRM